MVSEVLNLGRQVMEEDLRIEEILQIDNDAWTDPKVPDSEAVPFVLRTGSLYGSAKRVREQVAELRDVGVRYLLCQTGFGAMDHAQNLASMRRFGEQVMPAFA